MFSSLLIVLSIECYVICFAQQETRVNRQRIFVRERERDYRLICCLPCSFKMSTKKNALITGYTGESGKALVKELIRNNQYEKIILLGRRKVDLSEDDHQNKTVVVVSLNASSFEEFLLQEQREIDFEKLNDYAQAFRDADVHFCCLGTTRGKAGAVIHEKLD